MKYYRYTRFCLALLTGCLVNGQGVGGGPLAFSTLSLTARELAMGKTGVASSWGSNAIFWNPAGIVFPDSRNRWIMFSGNTRVSTGKGILYRTHDLTKSQFDYNGFSIIFKPQAGSLMPGLGLSILNRNYPDIFVTELNNFNEIVVTDKFNFSENLFVFSTAFRTNQILRFGLNMKVLNYSYPGVKSPFNYGGYDFGALLDWASLIPPQWIRVRKIIQEFYFGLNLHHDRDLYIRSNRIAVGTSVLFGNLHPALSYLTIRWNLETTTGEYSTPVYSTGVELSHNNEYFHSKGFLRGGVELQEYGRFNYLPYGGLGFMYQLDQILLSVDVSYALPVSTLGSEHAQLVDNPTKFNLSFLWKIKGKNND